MAAIFRPSANLTASLTLLAVHNGRCWPALATGGRGHASTGRATSAGTLASGSIQSRASRGRSRARLPVLPCLSGSFVECWLAADLHLHDLPFANLDERGFTGAGTTKFWRMTNQSHGTESPICRITSISTTAFTSPKASVVQAVTERWTACPSLIRPRSSQWDSVWIVTATPDPNCGRVIKSTIRNGNAAPPRRRRPRCWRSIRSAAAS